MTQNQKNSEPKMASNFGFEAFTPMSYYRHRNGVKKSFLTCSLRPTAYRFFTGAYSLGLTATGFYGGHHLVAKTRWYHRW